MCLSAIDACIFDLGESSKITYFVPPFSVGSIQLDTLPNQVLSANGLIPITILRESANAEQLIQNFTRNDDVFSESFLQGNHSGFLFTLSVSFSRHSLASSM